MSHARETSVSLNLSVTWYIGCIASVEAHQWMTGNTPACCVCMVNAAERQRTNSHFWKGSYASDCRSISIYAQVHQTFKYPKEFLRHYLLQLLLQMSYLALSVLPSANLLCIRGTGGLRIASGLHRLLLGICSSSLCLMLQSILLAFLCQYLLCTHWMSNTCKCVELTATANTHLVHPCFGWAFLNALKRLRERPRSAPFLRHGPKKERPSASIRQGSRHYAAGISNSSCHVHTYAAAGWQGMTGRLDFAGTPPSDGNFCGGRSLFVFCGGFPHAMRTLIGVSSRLAMA